MGSSEGPADGIAVEAFNTEKACRCGQAFFCFVTVYQEAT